MALAVHVTELKRFNLAIAAQYAEPLRGFLAGISGMQHSIIAGSYRRCRETVGDLDILVTARDSNR